MLRAAGISTILTPFRAPDCNAYAERFIRSIKEERLDRMIFLGMGSPLRTLAAYVEHDHVERAHQGRASLVPERIVMPRPAPRMTA